jgi:outer membrane protein OmpA-like peptidoglycan-associated protein
MYSRCLLFICYFSLIACAHHSTENTEDSQQFGSGLPSKHAETAPKPYKVEPFLKEHKTLEDQDDDGVIDKRDQCDKNSTNAVIDNEGCVESFNEIQSIDLGIQFASNSAEISKEYYPVIENLAKTYNQNQKFMLLIEGHTDNTGSPTSNLTLSKQRADAVANVLINQYQVDSKKILTAGFGADQPIASNGSKEGRQKNRRMIAHIITQERVIAKQYDIWTIELGSSSKSSTKQFNAI